MKMMKDFDKQIDKIDGVTSTSEPPRYWYSTGNYVLNRIISKSFYRGIPQGRITSLAGPSGAGKSFLLGNIIAQAQRDGAYILMIDSENAFDQDFAQAIGVSTNDNCYNYKSVITIEHVIKIISTFLKMYRKEHGNAPDAPQVLIAVDSLDMLLTDSEYDNFAKGKNVGDQGQKAKQLKSMLKQFVQAIKDLNVAMVVTTHVYSAKAEQILKGEGVWVVNAAVRFALSQIVLLTKLKLKEDSVITGIRMKCEGFKTRFTKPFQNVTIEVPYDTGMDPYSGLLDVAIGLGVVTQAGSRYTLDGENKSWYAKEMVERVTAILTKCEECANAFLDAKIDSAQEIHVSKDELDAALSNKMQQKLE